MPDLRVRTATTQACSVCGQLLDDEAREREGGEIAFLGAARYAWCVACGRQVPRPWSEEYQARWNRYFKRRASEHPRDDPAAPDAPPMDVSATEADAASVAAPRFPWRLANTEGVTIYVTIVVTGRDFLVRWYRGTQAEGQDRCHSWDEAVRRAQEFREQLLRQGFKEV